MLEVVEKPHSHYLLFDNLFTGYDLLVQLRNIEYRATGTMHERKPTKQVSSEANNIDDKAKKWVI